MQANALPKMDLIELLTRIEWLLHRQHLKTHSQHGPFGDPRKGQGRVIAMLKMKPEISQKDLAYLLDMRPQSLGELLTKLEKSGHITRKPSEQDKRVMLVSLTAEGENVAEPESPFDKVFDCLDETEQQQLAEYLQRVIESLEASLGNQSDLDDMPDPRLGHPLRGPEFGHGGRPNPFHHGHGGHPFDFNRGFRGKGSKNDEE